MQARLRHFHAVHVDRECLRLILSYLDPLGVQQRRQRRLKRRRYMCKGPNYLYHVDGWDKLKPFGLAVHGCIDGFSRRIMWLECGRTNNDPFVVCSYFCKLIADIGGVPHLIRADRGTENVNIEILQRLFRSEHPDVRARRVTTFLYGKSSSNQRIESWWSRFPSMGLEAWIQHMKTLVLHGIIDTSVPMHLELIRYCYMDLLRKELLTVQSEWNSHHIRPVSKSVSPSGKPDVIYHFPELYNTVSYMRPVSEITLRQYNRLACDESIDCLPLYKALFDSVAMEQNLTIPLSLEEAANKFTQILDVLEEEISDLEM